MTYSLFEIGLERSEHGDQHKKMLFFFNFNYVNFNWVMLH